MNTPRFLKTLLFITTFVICIIVLHVFGLISGIERTFANILHRTSSNVYTVSVWKNDALEDISMSPEEMIQALHELQDRYRDAIVDQAELVQLQDAYENIKLQLAFFSEYTVEYRTAHITAKNVDPFESSVSLHFENAESLFSLGAPAVTESGIFVGVVTQIQDSIVTVRLLGDGQTKIGASLLNKEKTIGVVEGGFGKSIRMNFIPQNERVSAGDIVVSSGLSEQIPYGLPIGVVEAVEKEPYQPFQSAIIAPLAKPNTLRILSIITSNHTIEE